MLTEDGDVVDLSECQLVSIPEAIYHLMRNTVILNCNLSSNVLRKIPAIFAMKFLSITELNLSNNRLSTLPDEFQDFTELTKLDLSGNSFFMMPKVVFKLPNLTHLDLHKNYIGTLEVNKLKSCPKLEEINFEDNPLSPAVRRELQDLQLSGIKIRLSPPDEDDDLDLEFDPSPPREY
ncbi:LRRC20, partial [Cordylochernes scorpioides]